MMADLGLEPRAAELEGSSERRQWIFQVKLFTDSLIRLLLRAQRRKSFRIYPILVFGRNVATQAIDFVVRCDVFAAIIRLVQRPTPTVAP